MNSNFRRGCLSALAGFLATAANFRGSDSPDVKVINNVYEDIPVLLPNMLNSSMPPDMFGRMYAGSSLKRKNDIRRKHNAKYHKK